MFSLSFVVVQPSGRRCIIFVYCSSVQVAKRSDRQEIVRGWAPMAPVAEELRRLRLFWTPPLVVIFGVRCWRRFVPELPLSSRGMGISSVGLVVVMIFVIHTAV